MDFGRPRSLLGCLRMGELGWMGSVQMETQRTRMAAVLRKRVYSTTRPSVLQQPSVYSMNDVQTSLTLFLRDVAERCPRAWSEIPVLAFVGKVHGSLSTSWLETPHGELVVVYLVSENES